MIVVTRDLLVRGFDDQTHSKLGNAAEKMGVSLNSIVKDAVDKWLKHNSEIPKKHDLILYADNESFLHLLRSIDNIAKDVGLFRCFCGPPAHFATSLLNRLQWFNGTVQPYNISQKNIKKFFSSTIEKILKTAKGKQLCLFDFAIEDYAKSSLRDAIQLESGYNSNRLDGMVFCPFQIDTIGKEITNLMKIFEVHDQIFILNNSEVYKIHVTRESIHKLFLG